MKIERLSIRLGYWSLAALVVQSTLFMYLFGMDLNRNPKATLAMMIDGSAHRPYVYRALTPRLAGLFGPYMPQLTNGLAGQAAAAIDPDRPGESLVVVILMNAGLLGFVWGLRRIAMYFGLLEIAQDILPLAALPFLLAARLWAYIYDLPMLGLFTVCLALALEGSPLVYLAAFTAACLCKETALLLIPAWLVIHWRRPGWLKWAGVQLGIFGLVKLILTLALAGSPGGIVEVHWLDQFNAFFGGGPFGVLEMLYRVGLLAALALVNWREKPHELRGLFLVVCLPMLGLFWLFGMPGEIRVFLEVWPLLALVLWFSFWPPVRRQPAHVIISIVE